MIQNDICKDRELPPCHITRYQQRCVITSLLPSPSDAAAARVAPAVPLSSASAAGGATVAAPVIAVLVFACNRVTVSRHLDQLLRHRPDPARFPIIVSQDCGDKPTADVIASYGTLVTHIKVRWEWRRG